MNATSVVLTDARLAAHLAETAGRLLLEVRNADLLAAKALGKTGDTVANRFLIDALQASRPDDGLLSEEEKDNGERLHKSRVWIIDPLDGTREYGEGRSDWAVHVALTIDGTPVAGAVALPGLGLTFCSEEPATPDRPLPDRPRMLVSRSRPAAEAVEVAGQMGADLVGMGSAGAKAMAILRGEADIYLHSGGQYEWDSCAPVVVAQAHGLHCSRLDGSALRYNQANAWLPDLLICRREYAGQALEFVARTRTG